MEREVNESLFNRDFIQNYVTEYVAKGLRIAPYLDYQETDADNYVFYNEKQSPEEDIKDGIMPEPRKVAPGTELTEVSTSGLTATAQPVIMKGYKLTVEDKKLKQNGQSVLRYIRRLSYGIAKSIETQIITQLMADALSPTATLGDGEWDDSTEIDKDLYKMQHAFKDDSLEGKLNTLFLEDQNLFEARLFKRDKEGGDVPEEFSYAGVDLKYGGSGMPHGTAIGFDRDLPPATVVYGVEEGAYNPSVMEGIEGYAPLINVTVDPEENKIPKKTTIYMAATTTIAVEDPRLLLKQTGL